jgi:hypothetical protein
MNTTQTVELYKTILEQQQNSYNTLFTVLIALTTILAGSSWLWNLFIAKKQVKSEVDNFKDELTKSFIDKEVELIEKLNIEFSKRIDTKHNELYLEISRLFGIIASDKGLHSNAISWWLTCLNNSIESESHVTIRISVDEINRILKIEDFKEYVEDDLNMEFAKETLNKIPETLRLEKNEILRALSKLKINAQ